MNICKFFSFPVSLNQSHGGDAYSGDLCISTARFLKRKGPRRAYRYYLNGSGETLLGKGVMSVGLTMISAFCPGGGFAVFIFR